MSEAYLKSGVDIQAGYETVANIKDLVKQTKNQGVMDTLGSFGALFDLSRYQIKEPVLVSGTDGVGTKLLVAQQLEKYDTIGIDCVAMCVNDVLAQGALPLFFLDYLAVGKLDPAQATQIVSGVTTGCVQGQLALIGGETAEMPGLYATQEFDLAGFCVGVAEKAHVLTKERVQAGDYLIGLPSSGLHSNGYSLVRHLLDTHDIGYDQVYQGLDLQEVLLEPTTIYVPQLLEPLTQGWINGLAHITGGGFYENIPRMFSDQLTAKIKKDSWPALPIFELVQQLGALSDTEMFEVFNMGIGMMLSVSNTHYEKLCTYFDQHAITHYTIGTMEARQQEAVVFEDQV